ncbi:CocE/NonD family hydrolase [Planosporangium flavigriseum]|uniref:X-Pro dipeptidyl-peptidase n=1 Tax=Planosporangium flavigriseum TaxID=373681 RepID=A0A8J3LPY5_9ACTN|nr:CocE/NonD family hydrolase [Planosporangium flavigriseum]NJC66249.1 CocE/NonD family hydrolase [Planosporangium flavigriseum]GIG74705.1 X-Pro dipeptidyl-peptidase [Planosporangium flavigriseum]
MGAVSRIARRVFGLPRPRTRRVRVNRGLAVPMRDGVALRADHFAPRLPTAPAVLIRTPYGRGFLISVLARTIAAQGFHVIVQSCRGTHDSGGVFEPMRHERDDGLDTVDWLSRQPWYSGELCTYGPSYVGFVQWALAADAGPDLKAMATIVTTADFHDSTYAGGSFSLDAVLTWAALLSAQRGPRLAKFVELRRGQPKLHRGLAHLPLGEADLVATGEEVAFLRAWLARPGAEYWAERGHATRRADVTAPVLMVGGWHDIFLPWQLQDYAALRAAGARPRLTIGPWTHGSLGLVCHSVGESIAWFQAHTGDGKTSPREAPIRVHVGGAGEWWELDDWPPAGTRTRDWFLSPDGGLGPQPGQPDATPARFRYDPADPTPSVGGPRLVATHAGRLDNRELEARPDVLTFTSMRLRQPVTALGPVAATIRVRASGEHFDLFVRLCDVTPDGRSWNVCDGLVRVAPGRFPAGDGGVRPVRVEMWPTAYRFRAGHRVRVQVSGGAHPRFARNTGTGEPLATATRLLPVDVEVFAASALHLTEKA